MRILPPKLDRPMKILFLDQSGKVAGAERVLLDIAQPYRDNCLVGLFEDGSFRELLEKQDIPVQILAKQALQVRRESSFIESLAGATNLLPLILKVVKLSRQYDLIYANTPKAMVVGSLASFLSGRSLIYHLHDILTLEHFSKANRSLLVTLANRFAKQVIAVSQAAKKAFIAAGGRAEIIDVVYNGFKPEVFKGYDRERTSFRQQLGVDDKFVIGHFSRLSPWKGQHILIEALTQCSENVIALIVGDALFGEEDYVQQLHQKVVELGLEERVKFLGFRLDVPQLMAACDIVAHTSTAPEPASLVLIEAMLSGKLLIASENGGTVELVEKGETGILIPPGEPMVLAQMIEEYLNNPERSATIAAQARKKTSARFKLEKTRQEIDKLLRNQFPS